MKTNIVHVVTSLPRPVVGVAWQNRYEAMTASILALRTAAAVLPNVRGKTGEHALQLQMPLASVLPPLPPAVTAHVTAPSLVPLVLQTAALVAVVVVPPTRLRLQTPAVVTLVASPLLTAASMAGLTQMAPVPLVKFAVKPKVSGLTATAVMIKTGVRLAGALAGMPLETVGPMAMAMMPTPTAPTPPYAESAARVKLIAPPLVPFVARQTAVAVLAQLQTRVLHLLPLSLRQAPLTK